ncbi:unnamed protein product [Plutella xylostella]|uniref:(diamondback moth) hypothetical protein n=1 Tax=Plutella xylostella TaxID=51655 RepID=A0A8S4DKW3_PLUXY|nr:unnamed protein product [Plutella xylostella]
MDPGGLRENNSNQELVINGDNESSTTLLHGKTTRRRDTLRDVTFTEFMTVAILCYINLINYMDRFTLAGVLGDVKKEFNIGDDKAGLLQTVFVVAYMIFAPIFGYFGDRYSRKYIMAFGVALWTMTTFLGSFLKGYHEFAFFRGLVGVGEASYSTIAPTIISDLFVGNLRSKMLAFFYFAIPVGSGLGYIAGSGAVAVFGDWRWCLRVTPLLGVVAVALIVFLLVDPERGQAEDSHMKATSYRDDLRSLVRNPSFMLSTIAFTCVAFVTGALAWWGPQFIYLGLTLQPGVDISIESVSYKFGVVGMLAGSLGVPLGSGLAQRLRAAAPDIDPNICGLALLASAPLVYLALVAVQTYAALTYLLIFLGMLTLNLTWAIVADMILACIDRGMFARRTSLYFGGVTLVSGVLGVPLGSWLGAALVKRFPRAHPVICAGGLLASAPALAAAIAATEGYFYAPFILTFIAELALNLNWAIVADMCLYVVVPPRRSTAEAFQILISHMFGDAGSPYLIGVMSEVLKKSLNLDGGEAPTQLVQFKSLQYALFITCFVEVLGGIFFLLTAIFIVRDRRNVENAIHEAETQNAEPSHSNAQEHSTSSPEE